MFDSHMKLQNQTMERELAAALSEARINLTMNSKLEKSCSTSWGTSSAGIRNTLSKTLAECTETDEETEAKQMERMGFEGHYSTVALTGTDEYSKVNRTPETDRVTRTKKLNCRHAVSSQTGSTEHIEPSNTIISKLRNGCLEGHNGDTKNCADRSSRHMERQSNHCHE